MRLELIDAIKTLGQVWNFHVIAVRPPFQDLDGFDHGLRKHLKPDFDFARMGRQMLESTPANTFLMLTDELECHYVLFSLPDQPGCVYLCGPAIHSQMSDNLRSQLQTTFGAEGLHNAIQYYQQITRDDGTHLLLSIVRLCEKAYPELEFQYRTTQIYPSMALGLMELSIPTESHIKLLMEESRQERRHLFGQVLAAVSMGDTKTALNVLLDFEKLPSEELPPSQLCDLLLRINTECCLAARQSRSVNQDYIETVYRAYQEKITLEADWQKRHSLLRQIVTDYCECVRTHSLSQYSPPVRKVIDYIHLHSEESLSLKFFSQMCNFSASYLSNLFRTETGATLTEYINRYRVEQAAVLLQYTSLSISQISENVGFLDENYFTRIFKRAKGMPPSQYRKTQDTGAILRANWD